jgi:hypothetical protein
VYLFRYDPWFVWILTLTGMGRRFSRITLDRENLTVRMGFGFRCSVPRSAIRAVKPNDRRILAWGVHWWRGRWLVNGSSTGVVVVAIDPPVRASVLGWPVRLRELAVSLEQPEPFLAEFNGPQPS